MTPVVNGLQAEFEGTVDFIILNAGLGDGKQIFESYALPGHPGFVLLATDGNTVWRAFGPQAEEDIRAEIEGALTPGGTTKSTPTT